MSEELKKINEKIKELESQRQKLDDELYPLRKKQRELEMGNFNFEKKYIKFSDGGSFMYVDWMCRSAEQVELYGLYFSSNMEQTPYVEEQLFEFCGYRRRVFKVLRDLEKVTEITKDEFEKEFERLSNGDLLRERFKKVLKHYDEQGKTNA